MSADRIQIRNRSRTHRLLVHVASRFPPVATGDLLALHDLNPGGRVTVDVPAVGGIAITEVPVTHEH
ncbi:MAG: hypothetical protein ACTHK2_09060 [Dokdonella sp.]|uniref:hypothetical protein n=1 Tax=Dokdonella sp. TaxID=2291710 RepID=UPI003F814C8D